MNGSSTMPSAGRCLDRFFGAKTAGVSYEKVGKNMGIEKDCLTCLN